MEPDNSSSIYLPEEAAPPSGHRPSGSGGSEAAVMNASSKPESKSINSTACTGRGDALEAAVRDYYRQRAASGETSPGELEHGEASAVSGNAGLRWAQENTDTVEKEELQLSPRRRNIDDCIAELQKETKFPTLPRRSADGADTAVFIDPPALEAGVTDSQYRDIKSYYQRPFFVHSKALLNTGSEKLAADLGPTAQFRIKRRRLRQVQQVQAQNPDITKFIDLTPKVEGQDAVQMVMELSCPLGVRLWGLATQRWNIAKSLIGGLDDFVAPVDESSALVEEQTPGNRQDETNFDKEYRVPEDYTSLRHRACIQRILLAVEGLDPMLDSAPKVYSTAVLARSLGILQSPLTDYVVAWLRASPNNVFTEVLPEVSIKIAECLHCGTIARDAFAILVGERALETKIERAGYPDFHPKGETIFHRRKEDLHEVWENRIQYARLSFLDRIESTFHSLVDGDMEWVDGLLEVKKLDNWPQTEAMQRFRRLLKSYVKQVIYGYLSCRYGYMNDREITKGAGAVKLFSRQSTKSTWDSLKTHERILTRSFWEVIRNAPLQDLEDTYGRLSLKNSGEYEDLEQGTEWQELQTCNVFERVTMIELKKARKAAHESVTAKILWMIDSQKPPVEASTREDQHNTRSLPMRFFGSGPDMNASVTAANNEKASDQINQAPHGSSGSSAIIHTPASLLSLRPVRSQKNSSEAGIQQPDEIPLLEKPAGNSLDGSNHAGSLLSPSFELGESASVPGSAAWKTYFFGAWNKGQKIVGTEGDAWDTQHNAENPLSAVSPEGLNHSDYTNFFGIRDFLYCVETCFRLKAASMLKWPDANPVWEDNPRITNVLLCLDDAELKYLPLWAGGFDDGTNGVFGEDVPFTDHGFGPGPSIRGVNSVRSAATRSSGLSTIDGDGRSDASSSAFVHDGYGDGIDRRRTYAASEIMSSSASESGESADWQEVYKYKANQNAKDGMGLTHGSGIGNDNDDDTVDESFDVMTPTGLKSEPAPDPKMLEERLRLEREQKDMERDMQKRMQMEMDEQKDFEDIFMNDSDMEEYEDDEDGDEDGDSLNGNSPMSDVDEGFEELESFRGFDGASSNVHGAEPDMIEDRGENYGVSKGKSAVALGKSKADDVKGTIAEMERGYNPTYIYRDGPEEDILMDHRP